MTAVTATRPVESASPPAVPQGRVPPLGELAKLFPTFSAGRQMLRRCHATLQRYDPPAPRYVYWHLARFVKTIQFLADIAKRGMRWLDLSSDPWFCLLARAELGVAPVPTGYSQGAIEFICDGSASYRYEPTPLEIREEDSRYAVGSGFDLVTAFELVEHLPFHPVPFLVAANRALRDGGRMVISTPNITSWTAISRLLDGDAPYQTPHFAGPMSHVKEYTPWELGELLEQSGFRVDAIHTFNRYPDDRRGVRSTAFYAATLLWHVVALQPRRVRNLMFRSGSTMLLVATKVAPAAEA